MMDSLLDWLRSNESYYAYLVLAASASIEYIIPPFPGDTVTLFGVFLCVTAGYRLWWVYLVITAGSVAGGMLSYGAGRWLVASDTRLDAWVSHPKSRRAIEVLKQRFQKQGPMYLALNRFLPMLRAFFFLAAGIAKMPVGQTIFFGALSALAWNGLIGAAGYSGGANWDKLQLLYKQYTVIVFAGLVLALLVWLLVRKLRSEH
ncbi:MAG: DedA family protein [Myxococcales bacterium]|nr:MAG: DedA family protein [Myxococcales bacterium]